MITLNNVTLRRGKNSLLEQINWTIYHKQRIGIIGKNGTGKSSLFALLLNELEADVGDVSIPKQIKLAHVAQETPGYEKSALDFVIDGDSELRTLQGQLEIAEEKDDGIQIAHIYDQLLVIDAYTANSRAAQLLMGLGFTHAEQNKLVKEFSGGWRARLNLAKALMARSDVLLLDEPTNHLDLDAVIWLEDWLSNYHGTLLIISHDRDFLDQTVDHIVYIENKDLKLYTGNYSTFENLRANELMLQQASYEKQQKKLSHMQAFVERFRYKASKARQAQSGLKAIERMDLVCAVQTESAFEFEFKTPKQCPIPLIKLEHANIAYGDKQVLNNVTLTITPKDRIAIIGPNGAGKSSLIKLLAGEIDATKGVREASPGLKIGYFAQHQVDHLDLNKTPIELLKDYTSAPESDLRKFLGGFNFTGDDVFEKIAYFSGGEKSRLALALIVWQAPNLLLLDEPTNHLDLDMRNALTIALQEFGGAMVIVSHDRFLVRTTADQLLLVADNVMQEFTGDLDDYKNWLFDYRKSQYQVNTQEKKIPELTKKEIRVKSANERNEARTKQHKIKELEKVLVKLELKLDEFEIKLADQTLYDATNKALLKEILLKQSSIKNEIADIENEWLLLQDQKNNNN